ncbi:hypothetical protein HZA57_04110, partial [Candidatus Poribacteria bacterium]|nr:hypothetical protein [Candidatus Poribacteria bacterium]
MRLGLAFNPFSSDRLGPFGLEYVPDDSVPLSGILDRLEQAAWNGELVGRHGAGKSTLLNT